MAENCRESSRCSPELPDTLSIHTRKITDSCRDKDCIEDLRVYLSASSQAILDTAAGAKVRSAELLYTHIDVEPVAFDRNHYCIDVTFFYRILADAVIGNCRPAALHGLAVFSKRAVLCGEEGAAHIYRSDTRIGENDGRTLLMANLPVAVVEALDPMVLSSCVKDTCECRCCETAAQIPGCVRQLFEEELVLSGDKRRMFVTLGQFSIIRLERDAQLVVPVVEYSIPTRECADLPGGSEDPCEMFGRIPFPTERFAPRGCDREEGCGCYRTT